MVWAVSVRYAATLMNLHFKRRRVAFAACAVAAMIIGFGGWYGVKASHGHDSVLHPEPIPQVAVALGQYGLPAHFFQAEAEECVHQVVQYRFVTWLDNQHVAVGFSTGPYCRSRGMKVNGNARILLFGVDGTLRSKRDIPYEADGEGVLVAEGEARRGPGNTLLFRIQEVGRSKSAVQLLDANLKDVATINKFLEQTTFGEHSLVFQEGFTLTGPRTYTVLGGSRPTEIDRFTQDWPVGTMDRKFGDGAIAYMLCQQELKPGEYSSTNVVYAGAQRQCSLIVQPKKGPGWMAKLQPNQTAAIIGILADGSVAAKVSGQETPAGQLVLWSPNQQPSLLPWITGKQCGDVIDATADMSRYAALAANVASGCMDSDSVRLLVFDRKVTSLIVEREFPANARFALAPDGLHYATFESDQLRIYALSK
jgi:hypothetical protein